MDWIPELAGALGAMVGETCWSFAASINTGSHVSFDIGRKVRRKKPLRNPLISEEERNYTGEFHLAVSCSWRLDQKGEVLSGGEDDNSEDGPMQHGLRLLLGRKVIAVELDRPGLDLLLAFEDELLLRIFCDELAGEENADNYTLFLPDRYYSVEGTSRVVSDTRTTYGETLDFRLVDAPPKPSPPPAAEALSVDWKPADGGAPEVSSLVAGVCTGCETADEERSPIRLAILEKNSTAAVELVVGCSWRLDSSSEVLCGIGRPPEEVRQALQALVGQAVAAIDLSPGMDLRLHFANGLRLSIFCGRVNEVSEWDNYLIEGPDSAFIVGTGGAVRREPF